MDSARRVDAFRAKIFEIGAKMTKLWPKMCVRPRSFAVFLADFGLLLGQKISQAQNFCIGECFS